MTADQLLVRPPAVAGAFYPARPGELSEAIRASFDGAVPTEPADPTSLKALVVPHAGYVYSGPVAASAYRRLARVRDRVRRVVLLGPSHRVPLAGVAVPGADALATPLGLVPVDAAGRRAVLAAGAARLDDAPHAREHSLEVQLPFLQSVLDAVEVLPLAVGRARPEAVAAALDVVWGGPETVVVVSTDLSHYLPYGEARALDARTAEAVVALALERIGDGHACGASPLRGLLVAARTRGLTVELLDLRSSGDTAGDHDRVVGYGAFALA